MPDILLVLTNCPDADSAAPRRHLVTSQEE